MAGVRRFWRVLMATVVAAPLLVIAGQGSAGANGEPPPPPDYVIDFETLAKGTPVSTLTNGAGYSGTGTGPIDVVGTRTEGPAGNAATIFDADDCADPCPDPDLTENDQGKLLILDEDGDFENEPDDASGGGTFEFDFSGTTPDGLVRTDTITIVDIDFHETEGTIELFGPSGDLYVTIPIPTTGNKKQVTIPIRHPDVRRMVVSIPHSGAIGTITAYEDGCPPDPGSGTAFAYGYAAKVVWPGGREIVVGDVSASQVGLGTATPDTESPISIVNDIFTAELLSGLATAEVTADSATAMADIQIAELDLLGEIAADVLSSVSWARSTPQGADANTFGSGLQSLESTLAIELSELIGFNETITVDGLGTVAVYERGELEDLVGGVHVASSFVNLLRVTIEGPDLLPEFVDLDGLEIIIGHTEATTTFEDNPCEDPPSYQVSGFANVVGGSGLFDPAGITPIVAAGPIPSTGGSDFAQAAGVVAAGATLPLPILVPDPLATAGFATADTTGGFDGVSTLARSRAEVLGVSALDGSYVAELLSSETSAVADLSGTTLEATSTIAGFTIPIFGDVCALVGMASPCTPAPNTTIPVLDPVSGIISVTLNQQIATVDGVGDLPALPGVGCSDYSGFADACTVRAVVLNVGVIDVIPMFDPALCTVVPGVPLDAICEPLADFLDATTLAELYIAESHADGKVPAPDPT